MWYVSRDARSFYVSLSFEATDSCDAFIHTLFSNFVVYWKSIPRTWESRDRNGWTPKRCHHKLSQSAWLRFRREDIAGTCIHKNSLHEWLRNIEIIKRVWGFRKSSELFIFDSQISLARNIPKVLGELNLRTIGTLKGLLMRKFKM